jgi:hypothetical protein
MIKSKQSHINNLSDFGFRELQLPNQDSIKQTTFDRDSPIKPIFGELGQSSEGKFRNSVFSIPEQNL